MTAIQNKSILVTGGAGFIGSHLVHQLLNQGNRVVVIDNLNTYYDPNIKLKNLAPFIHHEAFKFVKGDILDHNLVEDVFLNFKPEVVVHLAARAGVRPSIAQPQLYFEVNVMGTLQILEAMKRHKVKHLVMASSSSVYGNRKKGPFRETDTTDAQVSPYGASKKAAELICYTYAQLHAINIACLRFFTVYGPGNRPDMACFIFTDAILKGKSIMMYGDGKTGRDYTYIDDIVAGIEAAIEKPQRFEIVNLGNTSPVELLTLVRTIEKATGKKARLQYQPLQPGDVPLTYADATKAAELYGWKPKTSISTGIEALVAWYRSNMEVES